MEETPKIPISDISTTLSLTEVEKRMDENEKKQQTTSEGMALCEEDKTYRLTLKGTDYFFQRVHFWRKRMGLIGWDILEEVIDRLDNENRIAICSYQIETSMATFTLFTQLKVCYPIEYMKYNLDKYAFHEVMHLFFAKICTLAEEREFSSDGLQQEEHSLIATMENVFFVHQAEDPSIARPIRVYFKNDNIPITMQTLSREETKARLALEEDEKNKRKEEAYE